MSIPSEPRLSQSEVFSIILATEWKRSIEISAISSRLEGIYGNYLFVTLSRRWLVARDEFVARVYVHGFLVGFTTSASLNGLDGKPDYFFRCKKELERRREKLANLARAVARKILEHQEKVK